MSDFANTLHLPAILGGFFDFSASSLNSSIVSLSLSACWSRKEPVPAAQTEFMEKSLTERPFSPKSMSFESSPPISIIVLIWGKSLCVEYAWATISLTGSIPRIEAINLPAEPVTESENSFVTCNPLLVTFFRSSRATVTGCPLCLS